jgi:hypothetical protein
MFLPGADAELAAQLLRLQSQDLVVRNLLALASGVTRTAFFDLWHDAADDDAPNTILYGALRLLEHDGAGALRRELPLARPFQRLATALAGATLARRIPLDADAEIYAFRVERKERGPLLVAWRRAAKLGGTCDALPVEIPWQEAAMRGIAIDGTEAVFRTNAGSLAISVSGLPVLID